MSYNVNATFSQEQVKVDDTFPIDLYVLNASLSGWNPLYYANINQDIFGYGMTSTGTLTATGTTTYTGFPIEREDIKTNTGGQTDEVSISIPNTDRVIESIIQSNEYLRGCDVYILSGFVKHLPSGATAKHIGTSEDRFSFIKEKLYIDNTYSDEEVVRFTCKPKFIIKNIVLPRRKYVRDCWWAQDGKYLASECLGDGGINATLYPKCDGTLDNCRQRGNEKRFGGFPSVPSGRVIVS